MDETLLRVALVVAVAAAAAGWGLLRRRGTVLGRRPARLRGIGPGTFLFTATTCASCGAARSRLEEAGVRFTEITYEEQPEVFSQNRIERVPAVASVDAAGRGWLAEGVPDRRRLARWLSE